MSLNLIRRLIKGSALTAQEHDGNLDKLETAVLGKESSGTAAAAVAAHVAAADPHPQYLTQTEGDAAYAAAGATSAALAGKASTGAIGSSGLTMATLRILGRTTTGVGAIETIEVVGATLANGVLTITGTGGATDLSYDPATRTVASSTGADAVLTLADGVNAGLMSSADYLKLLSLTFGVLPVPVYNNTGAAIPKGTPVYVTGSSGTRITIAPADASVEATAARTLGLTSAAIANNSEGTVIAVGELTGLNTSTLTEGEKIWLSETTGAMTTTRPTQPAHGVVLGYCVKQGSGSSGIVYVKVYNGPELDELHDVLITGKANGQALMLAADGLWKNRLLVVADLSDSTATGRAVVTAANQAAGRTAIGAAASGAITGSGLTMATARLLGRTTAGTGALEEISVVGATLSGGVLTITVASAGGTSGEGQRNLDGALAGTPGLTFDADGNINLGLFTGRLRVPQVAGTSAGDFYQVSGVPYIRDNNSVEQRLLMASGNLANVSSTSQSLYNLIYGSSKLPNIFNQAVGFANGTGAAASIVSGTSSSGVPHHGIYSTGTTLTGFAAVSIQGNTSAPGFNNTTNAHTLNTFSSFRITFLVRIPVLSDATETFRVYLGMYYGSFASRNSAGAMIDGNVITACATSAGTETISAATETYTQNTWVKVDVEWTGIAINVRIGSGTALTVNSGFSTTPMHIGGFILKTNGITARTLNIANTPLFTGYSSLP